MLFLRQSTAGQEVLLGPFLDDTDGKTAETGLTIANTDIKVWKEGGTSEASKNSGGATHVASGRYYCVLDATDTNTLGQIELNVHVSGALPVKWRGTVLAATVYDSLVAASDNLKVDVTQFGGTAGTFADGRPQVERMYLDGNPIADNGGGVLYSFVRGWYDADGDSTAHVGLSPYSPNATLVVGSLYAIKETAITETAAGRAAGAFSTMFDVATPVLTTASVNQTGDSYARIGSNGAGLTSLAPAATALSSSTWTGTRAAYLDKLNITGNVASSGEVTNIQNNTRMVFVVPEQIIRPSSGTTTNYVRLYLYDSVGNMEAPDSAPEMELRNVAGTDLSARLASTTGTEESTGVYRWSYTSDPAHALEQILWSVTVIEGGAPRKNGRTSWIAETYTTDFTSSDRTTLNTIADYVDSMPVDVRTELATELARIDVATSTRLAASSYTAPLDAAGTRSAIGLASANLDTQLAAKAETGAAMTLTSGERDAIAAALLDLANGVESGVTPRNALRYIASAVAGVLSGAGGTGSATVTIKAIGNAGTTRLTVETDEDGNRTSVTLG